MNIFKRKGVLAALLAIVLAGGVALANTVTIDGKPCTGCSVTVTTSTTAPAPVPPPVAVTPVTPPPVVPTAPPPAGVRVVDANPWRGNSPEPVSYLMGKDEVLAIRIPASSFENDLFLVYKAAAPVAMSISNQPGDFNDAAGGGYKGCYSTLGGGNSDQNEIRAIRGGADAYRVCRTPAPTPEGHLYVNVRWAVWDNFANRGGQLRNFLAGPSGRFTLRRDG